MRAILENEGSEETEILDEFMKNIKAGYNRMISYETETGGYEWFG